MTANPSQSSSPNSWRDAYIAALFEVDKSKLGERIADAEMAFALRARELFHAQGDHIEEQTALEDALYSLHALRSIEQVRKPPTSVPIANEGEWIA